MKFRSLLMTNGSSSRAMDFGTWFQMSKQFYIFRVASRRLTLVSDLFRYRTALFDDAILLFPSFLLLNVSHQAASSCN